MAAQLCCTVTATDSGHHVAVAGEVDMKTAPQLATSLVQFSDGSVSVDLSEVTFLSSAGIQALVASQHDIERRGSRLTITCTQAPLVRLFEICGLGGFFHLEGQ